MKKQKNNTKLLKMKITVISIILLLSGAMIMPVTANNQDEDLDNVSFEFLTVDNTRLVLVSQSICRVRSPTATARPGSAGEHPSRSRRSLARVTLPLH